MVRITIDWQGKKGLENLIRYVKGNQSYFEIQEGVRNVAYNCAMRMREIISEKKDRTDKSQGKLENTITVEDLQTTGGVSFGVGKIANLPVYWEILNDGGLIKGTGKLVPLGAFPDGRPLKGKSGGEWYEGIDKFCFFDKVTNIKFIHPVGYIDMAVIEADEELINLMKSFGEEYLEGAQKAVQSHFLPGGIGKTIGVSGIGNPLGI
jgi:hypothetical protein